MNKLIREAFSEKVPLKVRKDWKLALQTVGGRALHREKPTCTGIWGEEREKPTMTAEQCLRCTWEAGWAL